MLGTVRKTVASFAVDVMGVFSFERELRQPRVSPHVRRSLWVISVDTDMVPLKPGETREIKCNPEVLSFETESVVVSWDSDFYIESIKFGGREQLSLTKSPLHSRSFWASARKRSGRRGACDLLDFDKLKAGDEIHITVRNAASEPQDVQISFTGTATI